MGEADISCPWCGHNIPFDVGSSGRTAKCPACDKEVCIIPTLSSVGMPRDIVGAYNLWFGRAKSGVFVAVVWFAYVMFTGDWKHASAAWVFGPPVLFLCVGLVFFFVGIGVTKRKRWSRPATVVMAILALRFGLLTFLMSPDGKRWFVN
jgi:hypothetical protein